MTEFDVRLTMLSDWRVGTGTGRHGIVDRLVARDADGLPYIPAKTLAGVWRDACEVAATALDAGDAGGIWHAWVEYLFGSQPTLADSPAMARMAPRPAALSLTSAHLPREVANAIRDQPLVREAVTFLKPGVRIESHTGRAANRSLRFDETARSGSTLHCRAAVAGLQQMDEAARQCALTLLTIGARFVEGIGGGRRRGAGRCQLETPDLAPDVNWLRDTTGIPYPPKTTSSHDITRSLPPTTHRVDTHWECARLTLRLLDPLVVDERTVGNMIRSADRIPGRLLLPMVLRMLGSEAAHTAARGGRIVITDATITIDGTAGRSAPEVLVCDKADKNHLGHLLTGSIEGLHPVPIDGYIGQFTAGQALPIASCPRAEYTHNTIQDEVQRPTEAVGGVYTYQAIAAGTELSAEVRIAAGVLPAGWHTRLSGMARMGRSRKDDFGRAELTTTRCEPPAPAPVRPGEMRLWVLSDLLVHDVRLRPSTAVVDTARVLGDALGVTLSPVEAPLWAPARRTESWHRGWGLPRPTLLGIAAGTCLRFTVDAGAIDSNRIAAIEVAGVGLRRAEGFGQVRFNDPLLFESVTSGRWVDNPNHRTPSHAAADSDGRPATDLTGPSLMMVRVAERAAWIAALRRRSEHLAATVDGRTQVFGKDHDQVSSTQLATLRAVLADDAPPATRWLETLPDAIHTSLQGLLHEPDRVWTLLNLSEKRLCCTPGTAVTLRQELRPLAIRTLVEDCLTAQRRAAETTESH